MAGNDQIAIIESDGARVASISDSVIGGMLTSKCAITQANRTYIMNGSLFAISCLCKFESHLDAKDQLLTVAYM